MKKIFLLAAFIILIAGLIPFFRAQKMTSSPVTKETYKKPHLANPASENCIKKGGTLTIQTNGSGGQYGLCMFADNMACEEWALFRGDCPVGGVKTTGYATIEQKYCAWSGGETLDIANATCTLPNGAICSDTDFYNNGTCN